MPHVSLLQELQLSHRHALARDGRGQLDNSFPHDDQTKLTEECKDTLLRRLEHRLQQGDLCVLEFARGMESNFWIEVQKSLLGKGFARFALAKLRRVKEENPAPRAVIRSR